ncbi:S-antigen protein [Liparis tanakae]|uniref:S-antigen protein n=1 Tax=Liparis tanakae TaxID=230148 RepID=A0A4Z2GCT9_9TELE|nr:S-antigen protein [Liparis tanakae]
MSPKGVLQEPYMSPTGALHEPYRSPTGALKESYRIRAGALQEPCMSPTGALHEPCRSSTGALQEPIHEPCMSPTGVLQEPYMSSTGVLHPVTGRRGVHTHMLLCTRPAPNQLGSMVWVTCPALLGSTTPTPTPFPRGLHHHSPGLPSLNSQRISGRLQPTLDVPLLHMGKTLRSQERR